MNKKIRYAVMVAAGALLVSSLGSGVANADPSGSPTYRTLAGVGSDTSQDVMNGMSDVVKDASGTKLIASYNATGSATITTKDPATNTKCTINRPDGSGAGRTALDTQIGLGNNCLQFARSFSGPSGVTTTNQLTYIPFATDLVAPAITAGSTVPKQLTKQDLIDIYNCVYYPDIKPLLPQSGSGTRSFWISYLGLPSTLPSCIADTKNGSTIQENDGRVLDDNSIIPFSVGKYLSETSGQIADVHGSAILANVDGTRALSASADFAVSRPLYNVVPRNKVDSAVGTPDSTYTSVFVGSGSQICSHPEVLNEYGLAANASCGSIAAHT